MAAYISFQPSDYFNTTLYTGTALSNAITGVGFQPDMTWLKSRGVTAYHYVFDTARGATKGIFPNDTDEEATNAEYLKSWESDGFTLGTNTAINGDTNTYVSWNWKGGTTSGITTDGSTTITPSGYSFNTTSGFSAITYTGNSTSGAGLAHGLGVKPDFLAMKKLNSAGDNWQIYHQSVGYSNSGDLAWNGTSGQGTQTNFSGEPDATNIFLGGNTINNGNTDTFICYAWASKNGFSKISNYTGNGNADGAFVYTGFKPGFILIKRYNSSGAWVMFDSKRNGYNADNKYLVCNTIAAGGVGTYFNILSNGFKPLTTDGEWNGSGDSYLYMAFAESPIVSSNDVPAVAR